jgi:hypothetical protein
MEKIKADENDMDKKRQICLRPRMEDNAREKYRINRPINPSAGELI